MESEERGEGPRIQSHPSQGQSPEQSFLVTKELVRPCRSPLHLTKSTSDLGGGALDRKDESKLKDEEELTQHGERKELQTMRPVSSESIAKTRTECHDT